MLKCGNHKLLCVYCAQVIDVKPDASNSHIQLDNQRKGLEMVSE